MRFALESTGFPAGSLFYSLPQTGGVFAKTLRLLVYKGFVERGTDRRIRPQVMENHHLEY